MPDEIDALVKFTDGWEQDGVGKDGLPIYRPALRITLSKPPYLQIEREATDDDRETFAEQYRLYEKTHAAKVEVSGYPLAMWPAISAAEFQMCAQRGIATVEQLAALAGKKGVDAPAQITEIAQRAKRMVELQKETGRHEARIHELEAEVAALSAELKECHAQMSAQNALINTLRPVKAA
jgi:septal ring factor EnvC (AmiA/AmiB activator)